MKKLILINIMAACAIFSSCESQISEDVRTQITDNYLNTALGFNDGVNASYSFLRNFYGIDETGSSLTVFGTDTFTNGFDGGNKSLNFYNSQLNSRQSLVVNIWNNMYIAINTCNAVITRADQVTDMDEGLKNIRLAEVRFLRAKYYFLLVQLFGPVHLTLTETQGVETTASRAPVEEVYEAIVNDLNMAVQALPIEATDYGRATKPAAEHLLAKVYLTRAGSEARQSDDYKNAAELAQNVINSYNFKLLDDFEKVFEQGAGEKSSEVIWSVQNSTNFLTAGGVGCCDGGNTLHTSFLMKYDDLPGMQRDIVNGRPWARFKPTDFTLETLFDRRWDDRYEKSFKRVFYSNKPGTYTIDGRQVTLNLGDTALYMPDREWTAAEISKANYLVYPPSRQNERVYPVLKKFSDPERPDVQEMRGSRDVLIFRFAETYLIAAEALLMTGDLTQSAAYINVVRSRAAKKGTTDAETQNNLEKMQVSPETLNMDFILDERARELLGELTRWFDLVRTGKLIERVKKFNPVAAVEIQPFHVLRPIPQDQIDRTSVEFSQNPGYN